MSDSFTFSEVLPASARAPASSTSSLSPDSRLQVCNKEMGSASPRDKQAAGNVAFAAFRLHGQRRSALGRVERQKITRACDACKARKSRCTGRLPCKRCTERSLPCRYEAPHRRGQPSPPRRDTAIELPLPVSDVQPTRQQDRTGRSLTSAPTVSSPSLQTLPPKETAPLDSQYMGPTSCLSFLQRAQGRLRQDFSSHSRSTANVSHAPSSIFNFGDRPSQSSAAIGLVTLNRQQAREQVKRYFDFAMPTYRFLHQGTVERWLDKFMDEREMSETSRTALADGKAAVVLMVLSTSCLYQLGTVAIEPRAQEYDQSAALFAEAEGRLATEKGPPQLESVQARLAQCLYLLGSSRMNQSWYLFGTTAQLILSQGLHRQRHIWNSAGENTLVDSECRKRVFWTAYALDKYFSIILGRPGIFRDEDIDQQLPERVDDDQLSDRRNEARLGWKQCTMDAPVYHIMLSRIINGICNGMYSIHQISQDALLAEAEKWTKRLKEWKDGLPAFLDPAKVDPSILVPVFQRQSTVLTLAHSHAVILATRQFLLNNFVDLMHPQSTTDHDVEARVRECVDAALVAVNTISYLVQQANFSRTFWFSQYISFCAISSIYVYVIRRSHIRGTSSVVFDDARANCSSMEYLKAAERCRTLISSMTDVNSPGKRYSIILDELKRQVLAKFEGTLISPELPMAQRLPSQPWVDQSSETSNGYTGDGLTQFQDGIQPDYTFVDGHFNHSSIDMRNKHDATTFGEPCTMELPDIIQPGIDSAQFDLPFDFVGWSDLDSWAMAFPDV